MFDSTFKCRVALWCKVGSLKLHTGWHMYGLQITKGVLFAIPERPNDQQRQVHPNP